MLRTHTIAALAALALLAACTGGPIRSDGDFDYAAHFAFVGAPADVTRPVTAAPFAAHPYMAPQGTNALHNTSFASDMQFAAGPTGVVDPATGMLPVTSRVYGGFGGMCATAVFSRDGLLVSVCITWRQAQLVAMDPLTLEPVATIEIPSKGSALRRLMNGQLMSDTSGGAYFSLSADDEPIIPAPGRRVQIYRLLGEPGGARHWELHQEIDLRDHVPDGTQLTVAQPDWQGNIWFTTRNGIVGVADRQTGAVHVRRLQPPGGVTGAIEEIQNAFVVGPEGPFVLSDHAAYALTRTAEGAPAWRWRTPYDRGTERKGGAVNQGSGTTPSLSGDADAGYMIFADNADGRIRMNVLRRTDGSGVCKVPLFLANESYSEDSMVVVDHAVAGLPGTTTSVLTNNSYGNAAPVWIMESRAYRTEQKIRRLQGRVADLAERNADGGGTWFSRRREARLRTRIDDLRGVPRPDGLFAIRPLVAAAPPPLAPREAAPPPPPPPRRYAGSRFADGVWRIDVNEARAEPCQVVWKNGESVGGVLKLATRNGLIYMYTREHLFADAAAQVWYLTAVDFHSGDTVFRSLVGTGRDFNNLQGPVTLQNERAYIGVFRGMLSVGDFRAGSAP